MKSAPTIQRVSPLVFFLAISAFSLVIAFSGCDNTPLNVNENSIEEQVSFFDLPYDPEAIAKRTDVTVDTIVEYVNYITVADGGVVLLGETDESDAFVVQPYSFETDTLFVLQVTKLITIDGDMPIIYDCGPDGLEFSEPAILMVNAWEDFGKTTTEVSLYWLNEQTHKWELQQTAPVDELTGKAVFWLPHFSKWGTDGGGGTTKGPTDKPGASDI